MMIFYYGSDGLRAQIFIQSLEFFLDKEISFFEHDDLQEGICEFLIVHDDGLHHQRLKKIIDRHQACPVILITNRSFKNIHVTALIGYNASLREVAGACRLVLNQKISRKMSGLNVTEEIFLKAILEGASNKEIARDYDLPLSSVKYYLLKLYEKLGVKNRTQAALKAREIIV